MKITVKLAGSDDWEDLNMLSEEVGIKAIRIDNVILTEDSIRCRQMAKAPREEVSSPRQRPLETVTGSGHARDNFFTSNFYGILDVINHRILNIHGPLESHLGYTSSMLEDRDLYEFVHPDDAASLRRSFTTLLEGQSVIDLPIQLITNHGEYIPLSLTTSPAEEGTAAFYATLLSPEGSSTKRHLYGYPRTELVGRNHEELLAEDSHAALRKYLASIITASNKEQSLPEKPLTYERVMAGGRRIRVEGIATQCDSSRGVLQLLESEIENKKNVVNLSVDFEGNILDGCPLRDFLS